MRKNIMVTDSILSVFGSLDEPTWLAERDTLEVREVGGIHNLSANDKQRWAQREGDGGLRIVERGTGREEIWFSHKINYPKFISLDKDGNLQSHSKFQSLWVPAMHFPTENLIGSVEEVPRVLGGFPNRTSLNIWCNEGEISNIPGESMYALQAKGMVHEPKDPKGKDFIKYFYFDDLKEFWENGKWVRSEWEGFRIIFLKKELNQPEIRRRMQEFVGKNIKSGIHPFGDELFPDPEEEFLFITEFCT